MGERTLGHSRDYAPGPERVQVDVIIESDADLSRVFPEESWSRTEFCQTLVQMARESSCHGQISLLHPTGQGPTWLPHAVGKLGTQPRRCFSPSLPARRRPD